MSDYQQFAIETYENPGEPSKKKVRARLMAGQGLSTAMRVECSSEMRESHPVGTKFIVSGKVSSREGGTSFLYTSWQWPYRRVSDAEAEFFLATRKAI